MLVVPDARSSCLVALDRSNSTAVGPVFFVQRRYGFNQETFRIVKFRSMSVDRGRLPSGPGDARRSPGDAFRALSCGASNIDEFPQLLNVLRGEMSLGRTATRTLWCTTSNTKRSIADYARRHNMKPGLTGWAQIHGLRGEILTETAMRLRVEHDIYLPRELVARARPPHPRR